MPEIKVKLSSVIYFFLILLSGGVFGAVSALAAAAVHEAGHLAAMRACGCGVKSITLYPFGADIRESGGVRSYKTDMLVALAGPLANLAAALFVFGLFPLFSVYCVVYALFNLLPVRMLDGGRALESLLLCRFEQHTADSVMKAAAAVTLVPLWVASVYLLLFYPHETNPTLFLLCLFLFTSTFL